MLIMTFKLQYTIPVGIPMMVVFDVFHFVYLIDPTTLYNTLIYDIVIGLDDYKFIEIKINPATFYYL